MDRRYLGRATVVAAAWALEEEIVAFERLLGDVEAGYRAGALEPGNFVWGRMYDESPFNLTTHLLAKDGQMEGDASSAKVVGARLRFAFTVFVPGRATEAGVTAPAEAGVTAPEECHVVRGHLSSRLTSVSSMHAPKMLAAIRSSMCLPPDVRQRIEHVFPRCSVAINSDLHPSNTAAERQAQRDHERWPSSQWRCSFHRTRTAETRSMAVDALTESALFNIGLVLFQTPGAWKAFNARLLAWAEARLVVYHGPLPPDVVAWRSRVRPLLFPAVEGAEQNTENEVARAMLFDNLLNGDGRRRDEVQHYCSGCCRDNQQTLEAFRGPWGINALTRASF